MGDPPPPRAGRWSLVTMLPLGTIAALVAVAAVDGDLALSAEGRGTVARPRSAATERRGAVSTTARAGVTLEAGPSRAALAYAATESSEWTSNPLIGDATMLLNQRLEGRAETETDRWKLSAGADGVRGYTDPFAALPGATSSAQVASTRPIPFEAGHAQAASSLALSPRTTASLGAEAGSWRVLRGEARAAMPPQQSGGIHADLSHLVSDRDTLRLALGGRWTETSTDPRTTTGATVSGEASWRRQLSETVDGRASAGAAFAYTDDPAMVPHVQRRVLPVGELGLHTSGLMDGLTGDASVRVSTLVDRYSGDVAEAVEARLSFSWRQQLFSATLEAAGDRRVDGQTTVASGTLRLEWTVARSVVVTAGALGRWQREETRVDVPSFSEAGVFVGTRFAIESLAGRSR